MVQVDVFWSYGLGSSFALAASKQLAAERAADKRLLDSPYFAKTLLFLALLFGPSGAWLLWSFPSWETMHAGSRELPGWLVAAFAATNVSQGALGFAVVYLLVVRKRLWAAWLHWYFAYVAMFFILVHGWDGRGYQRFFSPTRSDFVAWGTRAGSPAWHGGWTAWLISPVALTLYGMGVVLVPTILWTMSRWITQGDPPQARRAQLPIALVALLVVLGASLGSAIAASLCIHALGWIAGTLVFAVALWAIALRPRGLFRPLLRALLPTAT